MVLSGSTQHKSLKKLLQVKKVAPWRRLHLPLIYYDDVLALVILGPNESLIADGFQADVGGVVVELSWE
jgi:tRNA(Ile)-lysidine synthetase-like protein